MYPEDIVSAGSLGVGGGVAMTGTGATLTTQATAIGVGVSNALAGAGIGTSTLALTTTTTTVSGAATGLAATLGATAQTIAALGGVTFVATGVPLAIAGAGLLGYGIYKYYSK